MAKAEQWAARVGQWRESGLTAKEFCADKEFTYQSLWAWSTRLNRRKRNDLPKAEARRPGFVRVASRAVPHTGLRVRVGGAEVVVDAGFDPELLLQVVRALGASE